MDEREGQAAPGNRVVRAPGAEAVKDVKPHDDGCTSPEHEHGAKAHEKGFRRSFVAGNFAGEFVVKRI